MLLKLRFKHNDSTLYPCACIIDKEDQQGWICSVAQTWAEAEAEAIAKAKAQLNAGDPPQPKEYIL